MPEGPECLRITDQLNAFARDKVLVDVEVLSGRYLKSPIDGLQDFLLSLPQKVEYVNCKGKFIWWKFSGWCLFSTLGMTGSYKVDPNSYARVAFLFDDDSEIYYSDMRNFGTLKFVEENALQAKLKSLGPDMLSNPPSEEEWLQICLKHQNKTLVSFLMDQSVISGVGNIYKSESLYLAGLYPGLLVKECSETQLILLRQCIIQVLNNAYKLGGSSIKDYSDLYNAKGQYAAFPSQPSEMVIARGRTIMVYGQKTDPFGFNVQKINLNDGRTTYWVPQRQTNGRG